MNKKLLALFSIILICCMFCGCPGFLCLHRISGLVEITVPKASVDSYIVKAGILRQSESSDGLTFGEISN